MNPPRLRELEEAGLWPDFYSKFINYWQESLADILPDNYEARVGERVLEVLSPRNQRRTWT